MFVLCISNLLNVICDSSPLFNENQACLLNINLQRYLHYVQACVKFAEFSRSVLHDSGPSVCASVICEMYNSKIFVDFMFFLYLMFICVLVYVHPCVMWHVSRVNQLFFL